MGCFNVACSISHLDIKAGDKCYFLILKPNLFRDEKESSVLCHPDERYKLLCLPIVGEYDDYGRIEEIEKNEHTEYLEKIFGMSIESLIEMACEGRDVYDSYSEKFSQFIENPDVMKYPAKLSDLMKALFQEDVAGKHYSYINKKDLYFFQIDGNKYTISKNETEIYSGECYEPSEFLRKFQEITGIYLHIKNEKIFHLVNDISGCFVLKEIADSLMNNKEFWKSNGFFDDIKYWSFTPAVADALGFQKTAINQYKATKRGMEYSVEFKHERAVLNGKEISNIGDFMKITKAFNAKIQKLDSNHCKIDLSSYDFKLGMKAKYGLDDENDEDYDLNYRYYRHLMYLYQQSAIFRMNNSIVNVYRKTASDFRFENEYLIAEKLYQIFDKTNNMITPTCNASQDDKRSYLLMLYEASIEYNKKETEDC